MRSQAKNKKSESYPVVLSDPLEIREEGNRNKAVENRKRLERRKIKDKKKNGFKTTLGHASSI